MVQNAIDKLKSGKACGNDGLSAEHFIHSDRRITKLLSIHAFRTLQKHLTESITGSFLENCLTEVCLLYLSISCCTGTEPKHSVSNGVLQHQTFFNVSNGVRQGGILSPYLPIVYIDELSNMLNSAGIGCHIHNYCTNHVFYADDICVIAPSPSGLQGLLNIMCNV